MQRAERKTASVWGMNVNYVQAGEGPVVMLLHGLGTSLICWYSNIDALADAGYTVVVPDLPGNGDSDKPEHLHYDPDSAADFIYDFSQELGLNKFSLVGNSAGGVVASLFALQHPDMVEKMVLVASGGFGRKVSWFFRIVSVPLLGDLIYRPWLNKKVEITKYLFYRSPAILQELLPEIQRIKELPGSRNAMLRSIRSSINIRGLRKQGYILDRLKNCSVPMMTIWGAEDIIIPISHAEAARRELPNSVIRIIPECGHWPQMENPDEFNTLVSEFLGGGSVQTGQLDS